MGSRDPVASNDIPEGRALNRRISLLTLPNLSAEMLAALSIDSTDAAADDGVVEKAPVKLKRHLSNAAVVKLTKAAKQNPKAVVPSTTAMAVSPLPPSPRVTGLNLAETAEAMFFESSDSAELKRVSQSALQDLSIQLNRFPQVRLSVQSHVDERDDESFAQRLTEQRATAIVQELVSLGIPPASLQAKGFGSKLPIRQALSEADRARNRRIEFRVIP
jgi:outer membrane protein OmpA-like peptidoglycan-associated protein